MRRQRGGGWAGGGKGEKEGGREGEKEGGREGGKSKRGREEEERGKSGP